MLQQSAPEEAYRKLDEIASRLTKSLTKITKRVEEARVAQDDDTVKKALAEYEETLEKYVTFKCWYLCLPNTACPHPLMSRR